MPRYELEFKASLDDGGGGVIDARPVKKVIFSEDRGMAAEIGGALIGLEIATSEFLSKLVNVAEVSEEVEYSRFSRDLGVTWEEVLGQIDFDPRDVDFVYQEDLEGAFVVGFRVKVKE